MLQLASPAIIAMLDRYFSEEKINAPAVTLGGSEAHHLLHVMRAQPGQKVTLFDGHGGEFASEVSRCGRAEVELSVGPRQEIERELDFQLTLAVPLPKGDRQRWLVEKSVEMGVTRLLPLSTARSQQNRSETPAKLARYVIGASKQSGRNRLMEITAPVSNSDLLKQQATRKILAHPGGVSLSDLDSASTADTILAIGPEGGFTDEEVAQAKEQDWQVIGLGERILRVETAAVALIAKLLN